jgi:hypothetical protein
VKKSFGFKPFRQALGPILGIDAFSSAEEQLAAIHDFTTDRQTIASLAFLFGIIEPENLSNLKTDAEAEGSEEEAQQQTLFFCNDIDCLAGIIHYVCSLNKYRGCYYRPQISM